MTDLKIHCPRWSVPLEVPGRMFGAKGGRGSGKSHRFAEKAIIRTIANPNTNIVCIREIQKSLKFSAKALIEQKIRHYKLAHLFDITLTEIRSRQGTGVMLFQGMQDHTADSIKSLEGFDIAWVEEAQSLSARSIELLLPTIRAPGSQIWFSWNPDQEDDPVEKLKQDMICVHVNFPDNPFCPDEIKAEAKRHLQRNPETYDHVWLGGYNVLSDAQIFKGKWEVDEFTPGDHWQAYHGLDFGFSQDPTAAVQCYLEQDVLYIYRCCGRVGLELDYTGEYVSQHIPGIQNHVVRADSARPESISYLKRNGLPSITGVKKWSGSVEDGIEFIRSLRRVIIHPQCKPVIDEFRLYSYQVDKRTGDITKKVVDDHNHYIDAIRYALQPFIGNTAAPKIRRL